MRTTLWRIAVAGAAVAASTACGSTATSDTATGPDLPDEELAAEAQANAEADANADDSAGPPTNDRGNIVKALGEEGGLSDEVTGTPIITFAVDAIGPATCEPSSYGEIEPPENGHFVAVDLRVATAPELAQASNSYFTISSYDFSFIGADGLTVDGDFGTFAAYSCIEDQFTSEELRPGSQYAGTLVLDLPEASGTLIYRPSSVYDGTGWEWSF